MERTVLRALLFAWLTLLPLSQAFAAEAALAGRVEFIEGDVRFLDGAMKARRPVVGDPLKATETVVTGPDGEVHLDLDDGGYLAVRPATRLRIDDFRARGDAEDRVLIRLVQGAMRSFTGWVARFNRPRYRIYTSNAVLGIRGTDHETLVIVEPGAGGEPGTYDKVNEGATFIENPTGRVDIDKDRAGFAPLRGKVRLLDRIPDLFRATRNEGLLKDRHRIVNERMDERLEQRRRELDRPQRKDEEPRNTPDSSGDSQGSIPKLPAAGAGAAGAGAAAVGEGAAAAGATGSAAIAPATGGATGVAGAPGALPSTLRARVPGAGTSTPGPGSTTIDPAGAAMTPEPAAARGTAPTEAVTGNVKPAGPEDTAVPRRDVPAAADPRSSDRPAAAVTQPSANPQGSTGAAPRALTTPERVDDREAVYKRRRERERLDREGLYEQDRELARTRDRDREEDRAAARRKREQR